MPRAIALFMKRGMNPIAAPTDYLAWQIYKLSPDDVYPRPTGLKMATVWVYETLGMVWEKIHGSS